jgi:hypothetical protein
MVKQLKNRYNDPTKYKRFVIGIDRSKMKLKNIANAEKELVKDEPDNGPAFDNGKFASRTRQDNLKNLVI